MSTLLKNNLIIIYTGHGKGKTTASLGLALRAIREGMKVIMVQFIKSERESGEVGLKKILPSLTVKCFGSGFVINIVSSLLTGDTMHQRSSQETGANKCHSRPLRRIEASAGGDPVYLKTHRVQAQNGIKYAKNLLKSKKYDVIILDEVFVAYSLKLISKADIIDLITTFRLSKKPLFLVLTGRNCPKSLYSKADLVTEMTEIKHPFQKGIVAIKGIDY